MNKGVRILLYGLLIWIIPFIIAVLIWDPATNLPKVAMNWFSAVMAASFAISYSIAICMYFKKKDKDTVRQGWITGIVWYLELLILDLIVLVGIFNSSLADYSSMLLNYLMVVAVTIAIGYILERK